METQMRFLVKQWVDQEKFKKLLSFSKYISRSKDGSEFQVDIQRIIRNKIKLEDIVSVLSSVGVQLTEDEIRQLSAMISESTPQYDVEFYFNDANIIMKLNTFIAELKTVGIPMKYDSSNRAYIIYPYYYSIVKDMLEEKGYKIKSLDLKFQDVAINFKGELRDYQEEAVNKWKENGLKGIIALPTGAGKTVIGIMAIAEVKKTTLIVTFTKEQMVQWRDSIAKFTDIRMEDIGFFFSEEKEIKPITITTYQTAFRHIQELGDKFELLIVDEVHHLPAEKFKKIALHCLAPKRLGLSATPYRDDGRHEELFKLMGGLIYYKSPQELMQKGYLAQFKIIPVHVELRPDENNLYKDLMKKFKELAGGRSISKLLEDMRNGDKTAKEALRVFNNAKKIFSVTESKLDAIKQILELEKGNKVLIFTQYVDQAEEIARELNAYLLTGNVKRKEREQILKEFKEAKEGVLVLTTVGDEGLDIPDANVGIIVAGTGSKRQFVQRLGRILRPKDGKVARLYEIVVRGTLDEVLSKKRKDEINNLN